jgi:virulence-associated protein VagC
MLSNISSSGELQHMRFWHLSGDSPCLSGGASDYFATAATRRSVFPVEFALPGDEGIIHRAGDRLTIEPVRRCGLVALLKTMNPLGEDFPEIDDPVA